MSEETRSKDESDSLMREFVGRLYTVRGIWDNLTQWIHTNRTHSAGSNRLMGFLVQLLTESTIYIIISGAFAGIAYLIHQHTRFMLMIPSVAIAIPIYVGAALTILFYIGWDNWVRPIESTDQETPTDIEDADER